MMICALPRSLPTMFFQDSTKARKPPSIMERSEREQSWMSTRLKMRVTMEGQTDFAHPLAKPKFSSEISSEDAEAVLMTTTTMTTVLPTFGNYAEESVLRGDVDS